jgi:hypothetical protein
VPLTCDNKQRSINIIEFSLENTLINIIRCKNREIEKGDIVLMKFKTKKRNISQIFCTCLLSKMIFCYSLYFELVIKACVRQKKMKLYLGSFPFILPSTYFQLSTKQMGIE